jgi:hypothetical protein
LILLDKAPPFYPTESLGRFRFDLSHAEMVRCFGPAHRPMDADDNEPGPCEFWGYGLDGHHILIVFDFGIPGGPAAIVESDMADIDCLIDALGVREFVTWRGDKG